MKRSFVVAATAALIVAIGAVGGAPAAAAPPTDPWNGAAGGEVVSLTTDAVGLQLADLGVAVSDASAGSTQTPRADSVSSNISADVAGLGLTVQSNDQTAPPDAGGAESGSLASLSVPTLLDIDALTTTNEAHWDVDTACVTNGVLSAASTETAGVSLLPLLGGGVLDLGVSETTGQTSLLQNLGLNYGVQSVATGSIEDLSLIGGQVVVDIDGDTTLTATATGISTGTVDYSPATVSVTALGNTTVLTPGDPTVQVTIPLVADVTITLNTPTVSTTATSATATSSLLTIDVSVLSVFPLPPVAEVSADILPLTASATAPAGGIDCPPAPPVILVPGDGDTTDATPVISGSADPNASVEVFVDGTSIGTVPSDGLGNWTITSPTLSEGPHVTTAIQTVAGTPSASSAPVDFIVDATAPAPPAIVTPVDGAILGDSTPAISGTAEPNVDVEVFIDGTTIGTTPADGTGNWSISPATPLLAGAHSAVARAIDAVGNVSADSNVVDFTIDVTAPAAPVITSPENGDVTADNTPTITGTAEPNAFVTVFIGGTGVGATSADASGNWTFTPIVPLADGPHTVVATATDAADNVSADSNEVAFTVDTATPPAPVIIEPADGSSTNDTTPDIVGTAEANTTVTVIIDGEVVGTTPVDGGGSWTFTPAVPLDEGARTVTATAEDAAGNVSPAATPVTFTVDSVAPAAPVITAPANGSSTNDTTPDIVGTAEANAVVEVSIDGVAVGTTTASGTGDWTFTPTTPLTPGAHTASAIATDAAGNDSPVSNTVAFTVDTTAPVAPLVTAPADGSTVDTTTPPIVGTAEANTTVTVTIDGTVVGTAPVSGAGAWTFTPTTPLDQGPHTASATATDAAGNTGPVSNTVAFTVDSIAPLAPVITAPVDGSTTADTTPDIVGTAEPDTTVTVTIDGAPAGTAPVDGSGNWLFTSAALADGPHTVTARATDAAGNLSPVSNTVDFTVDTVAPAAPVVASPADGAVIGDASPSVSGTAEANSTVTVYVDGVLAGTALADDEGDWTFQAATLTEGVHTVRATSTDAAGNVSPSSATNTFEIDLTAPAAPVITSPADGSTTTDSTPPITGTAEPGSEVTVIVDGTPIGGTTADGQGNWTFTPTSPLPDGEHELTATATDPAGNTGPASEPVTVTIETGGTPPPGDGDLPATGGTPPLMPLLLGSLLVALGAGLVAVRRRRA